MTRLPATPLAAAAPLYALDTSWPAAHPMYNISQVTAVAVLGRDVHVAQRGTDCAPIVVFAAGGGAAIRSWGSKDLTSVHGLSTGAAGSGTLWATDILQGTVKEFDGASGALLRTAAAVCPIAAATAASATASTAVLHIRSSS